MSAIQKQEISPITAGHIELACKIRDTLSVSMSPTHHAESKVAIESGSALIILSGKGKIQIIANGGNSSPFKQEIPFDEDSLPLIVEGTAKIFPDNNDSECSYKVISQDVMQNFEDEELFILGRLCLTG